ncbi:hybrid sensor histidine kinase/response regulator [Halorubrum lipolyticum]|uniref:histidine kinase n=1 Tax=Halorubrum lipolyticum DSM 21995 TaxID=1227482 RepID=M0P4D0_9EURY|nr:PAS domain-containing protein [Halorubrum lipolyticum]EMA63680.1 putative signal-transducing histidine kinase / response regulator [Halorubrum lipolyticum DSM 21995]
MTDSIPVPQRLTDEIRVLHVDDEPDFGELVAAFLRKANDRLRVETEASAHDALDRLAAEDFDCVVSDYDMPGENGVEFLETLRSSRPTLPFVLYTGKGSEEVASKALTAGATDYLQKEPGTDHYAVLANRIVTVVERVRAQAKMDEVQHLFSALADRANDVLWLFTRNWDEVLFLTKSYEEIFGQPRALLKENPTAFLDVTHPDDRPRFEDAMARLTDGESVDIEARIVGDHGEARWVWIKADPITDAAGRVTHVGGFTRDISEPKDREAELLHTQRRYEAMFEDPNILVAVLEPDGTVREINRTAMEYIDTTLDDVRGTPFRETPWFGDDPALKRDIDGWIAAAADGEYVPFEAEITGEDGHRTVEGVFRPVTDADGVVTDIVVSDRDVTERREKERRLAESERRYRALAEHFPNGIVTMFDRDLTYTLAAGQGFRTLPVTAAEVEGNRPADVWGPAVGATLEERFRAALDGTPGSVELSYEGREWIVHAVPITDDDGAVLAGMTIAQDITERTRYQADLERVLELMERAEQIADVGSWEIDVNTTEVFWSDNLFEILDRDGEVPPLDEALDVYHEEDRPAVEKAVEAALETGESFDVEARFRRPDGETRWLRIQGVPTVRDGAVVTLRGAVQDITDHKSSQQNLERQNARLEEFASVVSHDLRNPLQVAEGRLELAREECESVHLDPIGTALKRAEQIIQNVLWLARTGRDVGEVAAVDLRATATDAWAITGTTHERATLAVAVEDGNGSILADRSRLQQAFENLFRNAIEHGDGEGDVTVTVGSLPGGFFVEDDGDGIPAGERDDVFAAGYSTSADGTGFGLTIVEQIAEAHGWHVAVTDGTGGGTRFEFTGVDRA